MQRFRGGLVFKAHRLLYHSTLGLRVIKKEEEGPRTVGAELDGVAKNNAPALLLPLRLPPRIQGVNYFTEMCSGSEESSYLRLIDFCITQL